MNKLHVDSVIKSFASKQVLTDIFISCEKGEIIGLFGRNGSGKSTLLKIIFGSLNAERKFVRIGNKRVLSIYDSRKQINYLPQNSFIPNHVKIKTIVKLFCKREHALNIQKNRFIQPLLNKKAKQLSSGERRVLEIFIQVYSDSEYTLIDEPFNGIAPLYVNEIKNIIKEQSQYKGFIITDHNYKNILDIATRKIILHDGGTREIKSEEELKHWRYIS